LLPTGMIRGLKDASPNSTAICLCLLFLLAGFFSYSGIEMREEKLDLVHFGLKYIYAWLALFLTLVVTTGFELGILTKLRKKEEIVDWVPVVKANLFVFLVLFVSETAVLSGQGDLLDSLTR